MRKWKKLLSFICTAIMVLSMNVTAFAANTSRPQQYQISVNNEALTLEEGEVAEIPLIMLNSNTEAGISPCASSDTVVGDAGVLKVWGSGHYLYWSIALTIPATSFSGSVSSTDISSGLSAGTTYVSGFTGQCYCARISGHTYAAHLDGIAYLGTTAVAKTLFNTITWKA